MGWELTFERPDGAGDPAYRFDSAGMRPVRRTMERLGMLSYDEPPPWPSPTEHGLTPADFAAALDGRTSERMRAFRSACRVVTDWAAERPTGIPAYKFGGTNDGWLVTPAEIRSALATLAAHPAWARTVVLRGQPSWTEWIDYLERATAHGGFRVE
ncbi:MULTISPECIES: hypothetical protein [Kitasatospora]|uniref:Uncharacterized protein n=1 Tax=Kitasatospora setae (strain ATCC 33774 / DSM 43861 / JCM 3304 / KCC A-0304 / NBRC 14216 / KM-6054) TaxID=452652 RepID=E4N274_KITSK|nr:MULTISPECIES: hypothetical protein [Kitasatospora]BAJ32258.1 hypothetical protein KSE_64980 [Kitasatospora setae KM-6054]